MASPPPCRPTRSPRWSFPRIDPAHLLTLASADAARAGDLLGSFEPARTVGRGDIRHEESPLERCGLGLGAGFRTSIGDQVNLVAQQAVPCAASAFRIGEQPLRKRRAISRIAVVRNAL